MLKFDILSYCFIHTKKKKKDWLYNDAKQIKKYIKKKKKSNF